MRQASFTIVMEALTFAPVSACLRGKGYGCRGIVDESERIVCGGGYDGGTDSRESSISVVSGILP